ncbi:hypothetical protein [Agrobacterium larrymoorei]|uniref:Uncharacterized protein n=1 Tax=Agrobacterium larrymoorei TaxID=160699 RepID=A0ABX8T5M4_9HYPH|nr:hypothetical protein [Agrobacterium larrymoorei]QYA08602.1 hypothetical protein J5285_09325 [Agrobacterium larrymoorei]
MGILVRRFSIIVLLMAIFAMSFAALVINPDRSFQRVNMGSAFSCQHSFSSNCHVTL